MMSDETKYRYTKVMADNLPLLRKSRKLTQGQLADLLGVGRSTVAAIESKGDMTWNMFLSLISVFLRKEESTKLLLMLGIDVDEINDYLAGAAEA